MISKFRLEGLDCANCAAELEREIRKIDGVEDVTISFLTQKMELTYLEENEEEVLEKVKKLIRKEEPDVTMEKF